MRFQIDARDLRKLDKALAAMQQPQLRSTTAKALSSAATRVVVPEMQREVASSVKGKSPRRPSDMGPPKRGTQGPLAKSVRSKQLRKRASHQSEMVAIGVGPRAWYKHFVIQGTQPHGLLKGARVRSGRLQSESQRAGRWHRGARSNDIVGRTGRSVAPTVGLTLGRAIVDSFAKQMKSRG